MRSMRGVRVGLSFLTTVAGVAITTGAKANGFEIPENGTDIMGRAGAWTARADTPLAAGLNPAGLAGQPTALTVSANLVWQSQCFQRDGTYPGPALNQNTPFIGGAYEGQPYPEVCKKNGIGDVNAVPQIGFNYAVTPKLGIALLPLWTPAGTGAAVWPDADFLDTGEPEVRTADGSPAPAPQRFMLFKKSAKIIMPTLGVGYEVVPGLRIGASFQWVITMFNSTLGSQATQSTAAEAAQGGFNVMRSEIEWTQLFTPAAVFGVLASPHDDVDVGAMFRWSADIVKKNGDVTVIGPYYSNNPRSAPPATTEAKFTEMRLPQPWELRAGVRWHPKRGGVEVPREGRRDFLAHDKLDLELDAIYSFNSQFDKITVLFEPGTRVAFGNSANAGFIPPDASIQKNWKNTIAFRLGGEYVAIPDKLGIRLGMFWQSKGQDDAYLNLDFHPGMMAGGYAGATYRVTKNVDINAGGGYIHVFPFDNREKGGGALRALTSSQPNATGAPYSVCPEAPAYRTCQVINSGKLSTHYVMFSLGTTVRF